jgi:ribokinase
VLVLGSVNTDVILSVSAMSASGETVLVQNPVLRPGGKRANLAVAAALAGVRVAMAEHVGHDGRAVAARQSLARAGVDMVRVTIHEIVAC